MRYFLGRGKFQKLFWGLLIKLKNFYFLWFLQFSLFFLPDFKLLLGFLEVVFGFFGRGKAQKQCYSLVILTNNFCFLRMANFGLFHAVLSL